MRTFSITGFGVVEVAGHHSFLGQPRPQEQSKIGVSLEGIWCSGEVNLLESKYLSSKAYEPNILGDATTALDRALETVVSSMVNEETAKVVVSLSGKHINMPEDVCLTCTVHLRIIENSKEVFRLTTTEKLDIAIKYKNIGVALYKESLLHKQILAFFMFSDAVKWLCMIDPEESKDPPKEVTEIKMQCYNNIALFHLQHHNYRLCVSAATTLLSVDGSNVKALYRRAVANTQLQNYELAEEDLKAANFMDPNNKSVRRQQDIIKQKQKELTDKYAVGMRKLFS